MSDITVLRMQVKEIVKKANKSELKIIYELFENKKNDWWSEIGKKHQIAIKEAMAEANKGEVIPHREMIKKYRKWLKK